MISLTDLYNLKSEKDFTLLALEIFRYQYEHNNTYRTWCNLNGTFSVRDINDIPFLPVSFFKTHDVSCLDKNTAEDYFLSSGTTDMQRSRHNVFSKRHYTDNTVNCFEQFYGNAENYCYLFLLPNYLQQSHSSLVCMADNLINLSKYKQSGFFKDNLTDVITVLQDNENKGIKTILFGVSYALLDLIEIKKLHLCNTAVFETGGMKGRRKEMTKKELHGILKQGLGVDNIASEYGMCELFSQAYAKKDGIFECPKQMKVFVKPVNDPKGENLINRNGIINIIDLANINTCSFIQTEDTGIQYKNSSFEITGRLEHSALRGCNLMYD